MADVFLSYAREDRPRVEQIAAALQDSGWDLWWDPIVLPGFSLADTLRQEIQSAKCVVVLWSRKALESRVVRIEAGIAGKRDVLVNALIESVDLPRDASAIGAVDLSTWNGDVDARPFKSLAAAIANLVPAAARPKRRSRRRQSAVRRTTPAAVAPTNHAPPASNLPDTPRAVHVTSDEPLLEQMSDAPPVAASSASVVQGSPERRVVFLCYRREDTEDAAGRLHDRLIDSYGLERVFMDIDSVPLGVNFVTYIAEQLQQCAAVLVMIGRNWTTITNEQGNRRLDDPADHVRVEVAAALKQSVPVIPLLVQNASMPRADDLPEDIRPLAFYNGMKLTPEFWRAAVERLLKELDAVMKAPKEPPPFELDSAASRPRSWQAAPWRRRVP